MLLVVMMIMMMAMIECSPYPIGLRGQIIINISESLPPHHHDNGHHHHHHHHNGHHCHHHHDNGDHPGHLDQEEEAAAHASSQLPRLTAPTNHYTAHSGYCTLDTLPTNHYMDTVHSAH